MEVLFPPPKDANYVTLRNQQRRQKEVGFVFSETLFAKTPKKVGKSGGKTLKKVPKNLVKKCKKTAKGIGQLQ